MIALGVHPYRTSTNTFDLWDPYPISVGLQRQINLGKQVLKIPCPKFHYPSSSFVVFIHGQRDLSSLPWIGGAAVQIS